MHWSPTFDVQITLVMLEKCVQYDLSRRVYQTKDEMKTKSKDLTTEVKIFSIIYHNIDNELSNEDKDLFL